MEPKVAETLRTALRSKRLIAAAMAVIVSGPIALARSRQNHPHRPLMT
jgi:hypothetical protein